MSELSNVSYYVTEKISVDNIDISEYITTDNLLQNKRGRVLAEKLPTQKVTKFKKDDILIANIRPYLKKIWQADIEGGASSDVLVIRPNDLIDNNFLYYALTQDSFFEYVMKGSKGTKMPRGDKSQIMNFVIPDLDIDEQIKIGKLLKSIDQKIQINNKINQELEAMAKTLYDYWFVQFDFPDQNGNPYKSSGGKMVYNPELKREIPEGWGVEKLSYFLTIKNGKDHKHLQDGKFAVYGSGGIMRMVTDYLYSGESILFPRKGTLNNVMYVNEKFWTVDTMFYSEVNKNNSALYVFYSVKDIDFNKLNTGTGVPSMTSSILYDLSIIVPEENILEKFNTIVKRNYETIKLNNIQNQELTQLRDWLLPMLMNGQVK
ncbi:restriction endonuclease subunit S [Streptococcus thermophilus]|nr:restriction endonuclease subunit S [Streptococcus thermophilus]